MIRRIVSTGWPWAAAAAGAALLAIGVTGILDQSTFNVVIGGLQAIGVVVALGLGAATLRRDSYDRRVDRTLALNQEFMTGAIWLARRRLFAHIKSLAADPAMGFQVITREQLRRDPQISRYRDGEGSPEDDVDLMMRFFERANAQRVTAVVELPLFAELLGRHALWWDRAIVADEQWITRLSLAAMGTWFERFVHSTSGLHPERRAWLSGVEKDFPSQPAS